MAIGVIRSGADSAEAVRRPGRWSRAAGVLVLALSACGEPTSVRLDEPAASAPARKPDIVLILADDLDARLIEDVPAAMPRLRELVVAQGMSFSRSYASTPLCCPSRVSILTGRYPHNTGVLANEGPHGGFPAFYRSGQEDVTAATLLRAAGYRTALVGKYLNGYPRGAHPEYVPPGWDEWHAALTLGVYFDYYTNSNGAIVFNGGTAADYSTDALARRAVDALRRGVDAGQPVFLLVSLIAPHKPALPAPRHGSEFPTLFAPRRPSFDEADISDKPGWVRRKPRFDAEVVRLLDKLYRRRVLAMRAVDDLVGEVVDTLAASGRLQDAFIFFTSDNGWLSGEHRYPEGKGLMYEEAIRVPLVVRGPGVAAGSATGHLVSNVDLLPTWLELAGLPVPERVDGRSLEPLLRGRAAAWREDLLFEYLDPSGPESPPFFGLRTQDWAYAAYESGDAELYDMRADPDQLVNRAGAEPDVRARLQERLAVLSRCAGRTCREAAVTAAAPSPAP